MAQWYYAHHGKSIGPIDEDTMRAWYKTGGVKPDQMVCRVGDQDWQRADFYNDLWNAPPPPPSEPAKKRGPFDTPEGAIGGPNPNTVNEDAALLGAAKLLLVGLGLLVAGLIALLNWYFGR